ncbi:MAG: hypothetical protein WDA27_02695 [Actinomycetota bacterium]
MRRIALAVVLVAALAPTAGFARKGHALRDVPDAKDCRSKEQVTVVTYAGGATYDEANGPAPKNASKQPERLAICVNQGGQTIFYFGGDMQSEQQGNDGAANTCGVIIVADENQAEGRYGEDWSSSGPDGDWDTGDDHDC